MAVRHGRFRIRPYLVFCRGFAAASVIATALCLSLVYRWGMGIFAPVLFFKAIVLALTLYFIDTAKKKEYYYYSNLGISKRRLWGTVITADMFLFLLSVSAAAMPASAATMP